MEIRTTGAPADPASPPRRHPAETKKSRDASPARSARPAARGLSVSIRRMPTNPEIYLRRLETVRARLASLPADGLFVTPSSNLFYLTGVDFHRSERLTALLLFQERDPVMICPAFEASRLR